MTTRATERRSAESENRCRTGTGRVRSGVRGGASMGCVRGTGGCAEKKSLDRRRGGVGVFANGRMWDATSRKGGITKASTANVGGGLSPLGEHGGKEATIGGERKGCLTSALRTREWRHLLLMKKRAGSWALVVGGAGQGERTVQIDTE